MTAYIETYAEGKSIIKIEDADGKVVERFEVDAIRVEMPAGYIKPAGSVQSYRLELFRN
jgi:hypothetical protein